MVELCSAVILAYIITSKWSSFRLICVCSISVTGELKLIQMRHITMVTQTHEVLVSNLEISPMQIMIYIMIHQLKLYDSLRY